MFGLFAFPIYGLCVAHMNDYVETDGYVEAASGLLLVFALGAAIGPVLTSLLIRFFGPDALFGMTAGVQLCLAAFALHRMRRRAPAPEEAHVAFTESLNYAQTVSTVDPSGDHEPSEKP